MNLVRHLEWLTMPILRGVLNKSVILVKLTFILTLFSRLCRDLCEGFWYLDYRYVKLIFIPTLFAGFLICAKDSFVVFSLRG